MILEHKSMKYIVAELVDGSKILATGPYPHELREFHIDILKAYMRAYHPGVKFCGIGGGRISIDHDDKHIKVYDYSRGFGRALLADIEPLLKKAMKDEGFKDYTYKIYDTK